MQLYPGNAINTGCFCFPFHRHMDSWTGDGFPYTLQIVYCRLFLSLGDVQVSRHTVTLCFGEIVTKIPTKTWCLSSSQVACQRSRKVDQICSLFLCFAFISSNIIYIYTYNHAFIYKYIYIYLSFICRIIQTHLVVGWQNLTHPSFVFCCICIFTSGHGWWKCAGWGLTWRSCHPPFFLKERNEIPWEIPKVRWFLAKKKENPSFLKCRLRLKDSDSHFRLECIQYI